MDYSELLYRNSDTCLELEEWMQFAAHIGSYLQQNETKIYIYVPNALFFSYFVLLGFLDSNLSVPVPQNILNDAVLRLQEGDIVYYRENIDWKRCSVQDVAKNKIPDRLPDINWHLIIKNSRDVSQYVPDTQWQSNIILAHRSEERLLNARVIKKSSMETSLFDKLYPTSILYGHRMLNSTLIKLASNRQDFLRFCGEIALCHKETNFTLMDYFHLEDSTQFNMVQWISPTIKEKDSRNTPEIFVGASKALFYWEDYNGPASLYIDDKFNDWETSQRLRDTIEKELLKGSQRIVTPDIKEYFQKKNIPIPAGVEILGWKKKK